MYQITNLLNGKIYVGVHKTRNLDDGYMGSGKHLKRSIAKYGIENFEKTILEVFNSAEEMFAREKEIVNEEFLNRKDTYNLLRGGFGGFEYINKTCDLPTRNRKISSQRDYTDPKYLQKLSTASKLFRKTGRGYVFTDEDRKKSSGTKGKVASDEARRKMSIASTGEKNSSFGTMWITNGTENKKIKKSSDIPEGWSRGRKMIKK